MNDSSPSWGVVDGQNIKSVINQDTYRLPDGNMKKIGGDIHTTVDLNPSSPTFGDAHSTMRIPGAKDFHS